MSGVDESGRSLEYIRGLVGLFAGIAALIYVTGGAVLALRLAFLGLPTLGVVGQLPQQFLFSVGATQVVAPALVLGIVVGLAQLMQDPDEVLKRSHHAWEDAKSRDALRKAFVFFYVAAPLVLLAPGAAVAILRNDRIPGRSTLLIVLGVIVAAALASWVLAAHKAKAVQRRGYDRKREQTELTRSEWGAIFVAGAVSFIPGVWAFAEQRSFRYFGLALAWLIALLFVLLVPYLRGRIRKRHAADPKHVPVAVALSCLASALLAIPGLVALAAALPLPQAAVCTKEPESYRAAGRYVGETKDRVYLGDERTGRIISIPSGDVIRVVVGKSAARTRLCARSTDGPS